MSFQQDEDALSANERTSCQPGLLQTSHCEHQICTWSASTLDAVQKWLEHCDGHHRACKLTGWEDSTETLPTFLPTRLLDIGTASTGSVTLGHTSDIAKRSPLGLRHATLSHCWGAGCPLRLERSYIDTFTRAVPHEQLPQTYRDSVEVGRALGIQYLWIDSLCILQDDPDEWNREAARMGDVYEHSYVTIAASHSKDDTGGLFFAIDPGTAYPFGIRAPNVPGQCKGYLCFDALAGYGSIVRAPLSTRAWFLQERLLSRRLIHFTGERVYWRCRSNFGPKIALDRSRFYFEHRWRRGDRSLALSVLKSPTRASETQEQLIVKRWSRIVEAYSVLALTYDTDRLAAVSGLARRFAKNSFIMPGDYLAGLWRPHLSRLLLWCNYSPPKISRKSNVAPSWSWASTPAGTFFPPAHEDCLRDDRFQILAASVETLADPFGQVSGGKLLVRGELFLGLSFVDEGLPTSQHGMSEDVPGADRSDWPECYYDTVKDEDDARHAQLLFLRIREREGLILYCLAGTCYLRRLGYWCSSTSWQSKTPLDRETIDPFSYQEAHEDGTYTIEIV